MNGEIQSALRNECDRRFRFADEAGDERRCDRSGPARQGFILDAPLVRSNPNLVRVPHGDEITLVPAG